MRVTATLRPTLDGVHAFTVGASGPARLRVAGVPVAAHEPDPDDSPLFSEREGRGALELRAGAAVALEAELDVAPGRLHRLELACAAPEPADRIERAAAAAADADVAILLVGTADDIEAESVDRPSTALPGEQEEFGRRVLAAQPRTVVVVNAGGAVDLAWARAAPAVLYSWFGGQEMADALAGDLEPGGRLPLTLAREHADWPAYGTAPDADGRLRYRESVFVGYRHFDARGLAPEFCFGHGLGYTDVAYEDLRVSGKRAEVDVRNVGARPGKEVVQLYVAPPPGDLPRPPRELRAFAAVTLGPDEARTVALELDQRAFSVWDGGWRVVPGEYEVLVGRSSRDLRLCAPVRVG